jgi:hypothetical protein
MLTAYELCFTVLSFLTIINYSLFLPAGLAPLKLREGAGRRGLFRAGIQPKRDLLINNQN